MLYLSKIALNPLFPAAIKLTADSNALHSKLYAIVAHDDRRPILFRVDATDKGPLVLLQTTTPPDWDLLGLAPGAHREPPATKEYSPSFSVGQRLSFRLLARPSTKPAGDFGLNTRQKRKSGPRVDCRDDDSRLAWLKRKSLDHGFIVESVGITILSFPSIKSDRAYRDKGGSFTGVRFDGVLVVTGPDKLRESVRNGIGQQKAFGFGLLSLAPFRE